MVILLEHAGGRLQIALPRSRRAEARIAVVDNLPAEQRPNLANVIPVEE